MVLNDIGNAVFTAALPDPCFKISVYVKKVLQDEHLFLCVSLHVDIETMCLHSVKNYNIFQRVIVRIASYFLCSCTHAVKHIVAQQYYI